MTSTIGTLLFHCRSNLKTPQIIFHTMKVPTDNKTFCFSLQRFWFCWKKTQVKLKLNAGSNMFRTRTDQRNDLNSTWRIWVLIRLPKIGKNFGVLRLNSLLNSFSTVKINFTKIVCGSYFRWIVVYPAYLNSRKTVQQGRRVPKEKVFLLANCC